MVKEQELTYRDSEKVSFVHSDGQCSLYHIFLMLRRAMPLVVHCIAVLHSSTNFGRDDYMGTLKVLPLAPPLVPNYICPLSREKQYVQFSLQNLNNCTLPDVPTTVTSLLQ